MCCIDAINHIMNYMFSSAMMLLTNQDLIFIKLLTYAEYNSNQKGPFSIGVYLDHGFLSSHVPLDCDHYRTACLAMACV